MELAATLNLQYGNILLATSTKSQLQTVRDNDVPFFTNNTDLVKTCILDSECDRLQDVIGDLGKLFKVFVRFYEIFNTNILLQMLRKYQDISLSTQST